MDGSHIATLLLTFFFRFMRPLIEGGHVYIAQPPLFRIQKGQKIKYAYNDTELSQMMAELGQGAKANRYKGLGEMNPEQLWELSLIHIYRPWRPTPPVRTTRCLSGVTRDWAKPTF